MPCRRALNQRQSDSYLNSLLRPTIKTKYRLYITGRCGGTTGYRQWFPCTKANNAEKVSKQRRHYDI